VTITQGTNRLVGTQTKAILDGFDAAMSARTAGQLPELWDGRTAERIVQVFRKYLIEAPAA
jgi:UDP-N-acetylglucosamine 2-epimerase (non-hydrolysing)